MNDSSLAPYEFDVDNRQLLIMDNSILSWIVRPPTPEEEQRFLFSIKNEDMDLLEEHWARRENVTLRNLAQIKAQNQLPETQLRYSGVHEYCRIFKRLIEEERDFEKHSKELMQIRNVQVTFDQIAKRIWLAKFIAPANETIHRLSIGDDMIIDGGGDSRFSGPVCSIGYNDQVKVRLPISASIPPSHDPSARYRVQFVFNAGPHNRLCQSLKDFENRKRTTDLITNILLGQTIKCDMAFLIDYNEV
jgi:hypothetical protein